MSQSNFVNESVTGWGRIRPGADTLRLEVVQRVVWSGRLLEDLLERAARASGLRARGDYEVLAVVRRLEPVLPSPLEVSRQLLTSQSGMTGKVDRLERQELIHRSPDPTDRRAIRLGLTAAGRTLIDEAFTTSLRLYDSIVDSLTTVELESLSALLEKLLTRLDELSVQR